MKLDQQLLVDQGLASNDLCLGAAFCTYTFDPVFFEETVLRAVLELECDPSEDALRFHEEARAALQEIPIAVIIDGSVQAGGRRLPYDVHLVRNRTYHPKVYLVLYESEARLAVGSGNLTRSGIEQNTELFFVRALRYDQPAHARMLRDAAEFLRRSQKRSHTEGTQLSMLLKTLENRIGATEIDEDAPVDASFVSSFGAGLIAQIHSALPERATITRIGVLAPFYEQDDAHAADSAEGLDSVLADLCALRATAKEFEVDVAVPWDDSPVAPPEHIDPVSFDADQLWAWRKREQDRDFVEYLSIFEATTNRVRARDASGAVKHLDPALVDKAVRERALWPVKTPTVWAPKKILHALSRSFAVQLWLHPTAQLAPTLQRRPLHAKLFTITTRERAKTFTYVLMGSANASRSALGRAVKERGNVEAGVLMRFDDEVRLRELLPSLVAYRLDAVSLLERPAIERGADLSTWIREVVHDAARRTLEVEWSDRGPAPLDRWEIRYCDRVILHGEGAPTERSIATEFDLAAASAEVHFRVGDREWPVPIRVLDLAALPVNPVLATLGLRELLAVLGRRIGHEQLTTVHHARGRAGVDTVLEALFGDGFGPTDVFKAWWGIAEDLRRSSTIAAFRTKLHGPLGARRVWEQLLAQSDAALSRDEVWFYGCELLRELRAITWPEGADRDDKRALLNEFVEGVRNELVALTPPRTKHAWIDAVAKFYEIGGDHGAA